MRNTFLSAILLTLCAVPVVAQQSTGAPASDQPDNAALMQKIRDLEDRVIALEGQLRTIKSQQAPPPQPSTEAGAAPAVQAQAPVQPAPPPTTQAAISETATQAGTMGGAGASAAKALNPDISAIGDFIGVARHNLVQPSPSLQMHES